MYMRRIFTVDPNYFPLDKMREIVDYLHSHDQKYGADSLFYILFHPSETHQRCRDAVLMTDPAVAYLPGQGYGPYDRGTAKDVWLKAANGSDSLGLVWPGANLVVYALFDGLIMTLYV